MTRPSLPPQLPGNAALFLDFDGTLVGIAPRPQDIIIEPWIIPTLRALQAQLHGALAIVSGRPLESIDGFLHPLILAAAGSHGVERRNARGHLEILRVAPPLSLTEAARHLAETYPGLLFEPKSGGFALHYRARPELGEACRTTLAQALFSLAGADATWHVMAGHMVYELKQRSVSKGKVVEAFLAEAEFAGRVPVFVGDDVTDEDGIRAAQAAGGLGIRIGGGASEAQFRLADVGAVAAWLREALVSRNQPCRSPR